MSNETLTPAEVAILLTLMAEARELTNNELKELTGATITGKTRTKILNLKLVESRKIGQMFAHELNDNGWARCRAELESGRPATARGAANGALYAVLAGLGRYLDRTELVPADIFQRTVASTPVNQTPPVPATAPAVDPDSFPVADDIEGRVRDAYKQLASRPGAWVGLAELRPLLGDAAKADVDLVLKAMDRLSDVSVVPEENQKTLTGEDRAAAVRIGGRDNHLIAIEQA